MDDQNPQDQKPESTVDKIVMGAIIGTAIGSALGATMAPKPGKETREELAQKAKSLTGDVREVGSLAKETAGGIFRLFKNFIFGKKPKAPQEPLKEIPWESDVLPSERVDHNQ